MSTERNREREKERISKMSSQFGSIAIHWLMFSFLIRSIITKRFYDLNPDIFRDTPELIESRGFRSETHRITTEDGYILIVFRIVNPFRRNTTNDHSQRPILLWHGIGVSSDSWLYSTDGHLDSNTGHYIENSLLVNDCRTNATNTLGFTLASCGYDVWLPNTRGGKYSIEHRDFDPNTDQRYWMYSLTELAIYDLPAVIAYVLRTTRKTSLGYIGHSLGTDQMFALQALIPESGELIKPFIALAPIAFLGNIWSAARIAISLEPLLRSNPTRLGLPTSLMQLIGIIICGNEFLIDICSDALYAINGFDAKYFNQSIISIDIAHSAVPSSTWLFAHLAQMVQSNRYGMMDFGIEENLNRYGQRQPPDYPIGEIRSKNIALFYSENDALADRLDVQRLIESLNITLLDNYLVPFPKWNHQDFQLGMTQGLYINQRLLRLLRLFDRL
ncbi:Gastric triacylglycerol lipase [Sarcoptes scabiei]|uniref:Gastric triacylglycerol lipase n=1 Tax=Sarcoptes scabiei TaxID=52283 RepID=A0A834RE91_SARSC|nr:Gastric triacylglycerol lipase [Sarcoptes scabiei]